MSGSPGKAGFTGSAWASIFSGSMGGSPSGFTAAGSGARGFGAEFSAWPDAGLSAGAGAFEPPELKTFCTKKNIARISTPKTTPRPMAASGSPDGLPRLRSLPVAGRCRLISAAIFGPVA